MQTDVDVNQEITVDAVVDSVDLHVSGSSYCYCYAVAMTVVVAVVAAAAVDSVETLAYGSSSFYSAVVEMDSARI